MAREKKHRLLDRQLKEAIGADGRLDLERFLALVDETYAHADKERRGIVRSMQLMSDEATALTRELQESTASQLRAVVDHVKDVILTVDEAGLITSLNVTGQRVFGHAEAEVDGRSLGFLLPQLADNTPMPEVLELMAARLDDTQIDLTPHETLGLRANGTSFAAEIAVSKTRVDRQTVFVICLRDTSERKLAEAALRDSEARYRTLVEQAPEIILVADLDQNRLVDVNENAVRFFRMTREALLASSPDELSPPYQPDGSLSANAHRAQFERTLAGEMPVLEWVFRDGAGTDIACEVRWVRLHAGNARLIRGSITDITERKRSELLAAGERRVFERLAANVELRITLEAITDAVERVCPESMCAIRMLHDGGKQLSLCAGPMLPADYVLATDGIAVAARNGSCAAAVYLRRQVIVTDIARDALWDNVRAVALAARLHSCWSTLIHAADGRILGTLALYFHSARSPQRRDFDLMSRMAQLAGIAIERNRAEMEIFEQKEKAQVTLQSIGDAVITTDAQGRIEYLNPVAEELTGWQSSEALGKHPGEVLKILNEVTREPLEDPVSRLVRDGQVLAVTDQTILINRRGQEIAIQESAAPIRDRAGMIIGAVMVFHDVSKERRLRRALAFQASHDALTGLINRREFENRLNEALSSTRADESTTHVLLYLDLDQFKLVNDTCGHQAGDRLLKQITGILQTCIRTSDTIARLGGDEFGVLLQDCTAERAVKIADSMRQAIHEYRFEWEDGAMNVGASIGIVEISAGSDSIGSVMSAADVACYAAKDCGRNRVHMYQHGTAPERHREMQWVSRLTRACEENRLELYYQPIVPIGANGDTRGHYELLVRMRGENGQLIQPAEFIPAAERYNIMPMIDRWVVSQALGSLAHYGSDGDPRFGYTLSINLSGTSLNDDRFLEFLINELQTYDLSPGAVCFEITETAAIYNLPKVVHFMQEFRARGCQFSLDDFGSGLSSFMYLKTLPVDYLKIDGQFIQNMAADTVDRTMVEAISQIGRAMGIKTIAERVESAEVLACLARIGIEYAQGFYIAMPRSVESLNRITRTHPQLRLVHSA